MVVIMIYKKAFFQPKVLEYFLYSIYHWIPYQGTEYVLFQRVLILFFFTICYCSSLLIPTVVLFSLPLLLLPRSARVGFTPENVIKMSVFLLLCNLLSQAKCGFGLSSSAPPSQLAKVFVCRDPTTGAFPGGFNPRNSTFCGLQISLPDDLSLDRGSPLVTQATSIKIPLDSSDWNRSQGGQYQRSPAWYKILRRPSSPILTN